MTNESIYKETDRIPYTYLIGWSNHDLWYYGCRYAKGCKPEDLWVTYFTSSKGKENVKGVREYRKEFGEPDVIQIRKTFNSVDKCRLFEHKVLRRLDAKSHPKFINRANGNKDYIFKTWQVTEETRKKMSISHSKPYDKDRLDKHRKTMSNLSEDSRKRCAHRLGKILTDEEKNKLKVPHGPHSIEHNKMKSERQTGNAWAKDGTTGLFLGRVNSDDSRWKTGEIVGVRKLVPKTIRE